MTTVGTLNVLSKPHNSGETSDSMASLYFGQRLKIRRLAFKASPLPQSFKVIRAQPTPAWRPCGSDRLQKHPLGRFESESIPATGVDDTVSVINLEIRGVCAHAQMELLRKTETLLELSACIETQSDYRCQVNTPNWTNHTRTDFWEG